MGHFQPLRGLLGIFSSSFIDSWYLITDILKSALDEGVTEILTHKLPQYYSEGTVWLHMTCWEARDEDAEGFVTMQHSGSRALQGKKPAVSPNLLSWQGLTREHLHISYLTPVRPSFFWPVLGDFQSQASCKWLLQKRDTLNSTSNFLLICKLLKKYNCKLDRRRLAQRNLCS